MGLETIKHLVVKTVLFGLTFKTFNFIVSKTYSMAHTFQADF